jgi:tetratricopeptide (TPR) repeat protein
MGFVMHKFLRGALVPAASLLAFVQPAHAEWLQAKSNHFIVYGDMPEAQLRRKVERLERFHAALRTLFKVEREDVGTIYLTPSMSDLQEIAGSANIGGFYQGSAQGAVGFVPERVPYERPGWSPEIILFHEYTHHILLSSTTELYPGWVSEGLAELFATADLRDDGSVVIGEENPSRGFAMTGLSSWTVERMLDSDVHPPKREERIELYSKGWLMLHYLLVSGKRPGQYTKFAQLINQGKSGLDAGREAFGDLGKLDSELSVYMRSKKFRSYLIPPEKLGKTDEIAIAPLSEGEQAIMPYRMSSASGALTRERLKALVVRARPIAERYPGDAAVQRALAEMEYDAEELDRADAAADRALAADPQNLMAMVYKGRVAAKRAVASKDPAQWKAARDWFLRANRRDPEYALPLVLFYDTYVAAGQPAPKGAVDALGSAVVLAPADDSLRMRMGIEAVRLDKLALARMLLAPVAYNPHGSGKNFAKLVAEIDAGKSRDELLAKAAELKIDAINEFTEPLPETDNEGEGKKGEGEKSKANMAPLTAM